MQRFFDHIFSYYDSPLPIGSDEIIKRLQMWLNNSKCGHKEGQKFPIFWWVNHQGESSHMYFDCDYWRIFKMYTADEFKYMKINPDESRRIWIYTDEWRLTNTIKDEFI